MTSRTLVAGIGNMFLGDDGFGVEVVKRLAAMPLGDGVDVIDFGIRGFDLACALLRGYGTVILIDAVCRGGAPGTLYVIEPEIGISDASNLEAPSIGVEGHGLTPAAVLGLVKTMGGHVEHLGQVRLVGCEPAGFPSEDDVQVGLSAPVMAAVDGAVTLVCQLLQTSQHSQESNGWSCTSSA